MWLWQKGRFRMGFLGPDAWWKVSLRLVGHACPAWHAANTRPSTAQKLSQPPGTPTHHKLAVQTPALGTIEPVSLLRPFAPADAHFHRPRGDPAHFSAVVVTPHADNGIDNFDAFEYIITRMFISKGQTWKKGIA